MSDDNTNSLAGLGSVFSAFGQATDAARDVESASTALREPSPPKSPPPERRSPSPPSFSYSRSDNTATYNYRPSHNYSTNYTSSSYNTTDCTEMSPAECGIMFVVGIAIFGLILYAGTIKH